MPASVREETMNHRNAMKVLMLISCGATLMFTNTASVAQATPNPNCTIMVPDAPLTASGLATPYQLVATDPTAGPCDESNPDQSAFVQAAVLDPATGSISIYNPLVVTQGATPAAPPVVPTLPANAIVGLWFGFNGDTLTLNGNPGVLRASSCVNGDRTGPFGQFAYCNAPAFFWAANRSIRRGQLTVPALGTAKDGKSCPTVRDFFIVDQDQSDNLPVSFLMTDVGLAQNTQVNVSQFPGATVVRNPSDEGLLARFVDPALGCSSWSAPDLADPGKMIPALALNELQAAAAQKAPVALIPADDPMALGHGAHDLLKVNLYRAGVDQGFAFALGQADTATYCANLLNVAPARLQANQASLTAAASPVPADGDSLFTFMAQRFVATFDILGCGNLLHQPDPISVTTDASGTATAAVINGPTQPVTVPTPRRRHSWHW